MDITEINTQPLSTLVSGHLECRNCKIVDRKNERMRKGFVCPACSDLSEGGKLYFSINIHILIDLIQESYHSNNYEVERLYEGSGSHDISVILYFSTLREALLGNLIHRLMEAQNLSVGVSERLLSDNKFHIQKQDKLFKSLTDIKWKEAVGMLNENSELDYSELDEFVMSIAKIRNDFIHSGSKWDIDRKLSTKCLKNIGRLINMYVGLHNIYVHPQYCRNL